MIQNTPAVIAAAIALPVLLLAAGCNNQSNSAGGGTGGGTQMASAGGGKAIYDANGCGRCHRGSGGQAPDLSHEGASRDAKWIADHIKDPKTHNPASRMPAFGGKINDKDLTTLAQYLASQK